jgi:hypothetical protein
VKRKQQEDTDVKSQLAKMPEMINDAVTKTVTTLLPPPAYRLHGMG